MLLKIIIYDKKYPVIHKTVSVLGKQKLIIILTFNINEITVFLEKETSHLKCPNLNINFFVVKIKALFVKYMTLSTGSVFSIYFLAYVYFFASLLIFKGTLCL